MSAIDFPSGPWTGFYHYGVGTPRYRMDLSLTFLNGVMSGDGIDNIGRFVIAGRYEGARGECHWTKTYIEAHDVYYRGFREGKGIWGLWELVFVSGGFHIWPLGQEECEQETMFIEEPVPAEVCVPRGRHHAGSGLQSALSDCMSDCMTRRASSTAPGKNRGLGQLLSHRTR